MTSGPPEPIGGRPSGPESAASRGGGHGGGRGPSGPRASFVERFGAVLVDVILVVIVGIVFRGLFGSPLAAPINFVLGVAYYVYLEGSPSGQTIGKRMMNIRVLDYERGGGIDYGRAAIRYFGRLLSGLPFFLGYFWMLWDDERQTWHDKLASTVVVPTSVYPVEAWPG
jgi:uncharacterized RDD family membrane protein YckC